MEIEIMPGLNGEMKKVKVKKISLFKMITKRGRFSKTSPCVSGRELEISGYIEIGNEIVAYNNYWDPIIERRYKKKFKKTTKIIYLFKYGEIYVAESENSFYLFFIIEKE